MDKRAEKELSGMFTAYREYEVAKRLAALTAVPTMMGSVLAAAMVAIWSRNPAVVVVAAIGLFALLTLYAAAVRRRVAARTRLKTILDEKLSEKSGGF